MPASERGARRGGLACLLLLAVTSAGPFGCADERAPDGGGAAQSAGRHTRQLTEFGRDQTAPHRVSEIVYQAHGVGNANLVVTPDGNVLIDAGLPTQAGRQREILRQASDGPTRAVVVTHAHMDHLGGVSEWLEEGTEVIAHETFPETQRYLTELVPFFMRRNRVFYPDEVPRLPMSLAGPVLRRLYPQVEPTRLVDDRHDFELGGVRFEVLHTPGAEGEDSISVWLPDQRILFSGDLFGPLFPMFPNLYTIRGEKFRFAVPYIASLERVIALEPEILVPSHFEPIEGAEQIRAELVRTRDAVRFVHAAVVEGMNEGRDVYTLMREIRLPPELELSERHGKVAWTARGIWEGYAGWFHFRSTAELYGVPPWSVHPEVVAMAGGADAVAARARERVAAGEPVEALHLVDMALAADPGSRAALEARLAALEELLRRSGGENHSELLWLEHRIAATREQLGHP
jgi:alkyl sulfatase BDS1-like metallo-beta-lactamase superfamily hydrolase